ncbi:MAG: lytic transglycosylase domain-containing protein [Betaproteobacteria bacterium]|nr:lytic transglycosylase domain-containing protein [Betaproteobacteria bacterium]
MGPVAALTTLEHCAPRVAPLTMAAIVQQESGGNPLTIHDNTTGRTYHFETVSTAVRLARTLIRGGHSVDMGLAQINSANLASIGADVDHIFDPCTNLRAAQTILLRAWSQSGGSLRGTLSAYNTGKTTGILGARYSASVYAQVDVAVPAIPGGKMPQWVTGSRLPPIRPVITWTPQASPLAPSARGITARW